MIAHEAIEHQNAWVDTNGRGTCYGGDERAAPVAEQQHLPTACGWACGNSSISKILQGRRGGGEFKGVD